MKILTVLGTRPEAIKMAILLQKLKMISGVDSRLCITSQHKEMLQQVLDLFQLVPDYDLDIMKKEQSLTDITSNILLGLSPILCDFNPDWVLVHGDTSTTFAASLSAFYHKISVAHVEAGLRTGNIYSPWPEEINRRATSIMAQKHYAPTENARKNLIKENIDSNSILVTGNTVIDSLLEITEKKLQDRNIIRTLDEKFSFLNYKKKMILVTGHRRENFGEGFENICKAILEISRREDVEIVYPVHLNPNVQKPVKRILGDRKNVFLISPCDYLPFVYLMNRSYVILTDSGGIQEEAPSLGKPVLVLRDTTERPEALEAGTVRLVGTSTLSIIKETNALLDSTELYSQLLQVKNPYGDGKATDRIIGDLLK